jgi:hypothetical protein
MHASDGPEIKYISGRWLLFNGECFRSNPQFCHVGEILFVTARDHIFPAAFDFERVVTGKQWLQFFHKRRVDQDRTMYSHKPERL